MFGRGIEYKTPDQIRRMRTAGLVVADIHDAVRAAIAPGVTTGDLDQVAAQVLQAAGATSNFLGYHGFPGRLCVSVNSEIAHGIPGARVIQPGDVVSVDAGAVVDGWHGDAAVTVVVPAEEGPIRLTRHWCRPPRTPCGPGSRPWPPASGSAMSVPLWRMPPRTTGSCGSTPATASALPCTRSRTCTTTAPVGVGRRCGPGCAWRWNRCSPGAGRPPGHLTTTGPWSVPTAPVRRTSSTRSPCTQGACGCSPLGTGE